MISSIINNKLFESCSKLHENIKIYCLKDRKFIRNYKTFILLYL